LNKTNGIINKQKRRERGVPICGERARKRDRGLGAEISG
jgi:hypothetical protein